MRIAGLARARPTSGESHMLQMRPNCECCNADLPPESKQARICSFECTFCAACAEGVLGHACPNCGGDFSVRPTRAPHLLVEYPASTRRVVGRDGCRHRAS